MIVTREMFSVSVDGSRALIKIWRRPDLDSDAGARNAKEVAAEAVALHGRGVKEVILDLCHAPAIAGPKSVESLSAMFARWAAVKMRVAVLIVDDPMKTLQYKRIVAEQGLEHAFVTTTEELAAQWFASLG